MFATRLGTLQSAAVAHFRMPAIEVHRPVINRRDYNFPFMVCETVLSISHESNETVVEGCLVAGKES